MTVYGISEDGGTTWIKDIDPDSQLKVGTYDKRKKIWTTRASLAKSIPVPPPPPPQTPVLGIVDVLNFSTTDKDTTIKKWCDAVQIQANRDISKYWTYSVTMNVIPKSQTPNKGHWYCGFFDDSDTAGALGWHDVSPDGKTPLIKIFTKESEGFNLSPSITLSHEIAETISDPNANTTIRGYDEKDKPCLYFRENADPVEALSYKIGNIEVSDFVTPAWWITKTAGSTIYDILGKVSKPFQILQGGYMEVSYDNGQTWTEINKFSKHADRHRSSHSRWQLYKTPLEKRKRSTFKTV